VEILQMQTQMSTTTDGRTDRQTENAVEVQTALCQALYDKNRCDRCNGIYWYIH